MRLLAAFIVFILTMRCADAGEAFTLRDAILMAVQTHPSVGEAAANRRATQTELYQQQGVLLPQVRLEASAGPEVTNQKNVIVPPNGNNQWLAGSQVSIVARQLLFDGFSSINEIWRQAARVDAAAARVHERSELTSLDATEAYIDVVRYTRLVALAKENLAAHVRIQSNVESRFKGGRSGEGDLEQTHERVEAARVALDQFRQRLDEARAKFRNAVGIEPYNLRVPNRLAGLPLSKDEALAVTLTKNPTIRAAQADVDAARFAFRSSAGAFLPTVSLEARATEGNNTENFYGRFDQESAKIVATWDIFSGGQDSWKRADAAERYTEQTMHHARLQRDAYESVDKAWAARTITVDQIGDLRRQITANRKVITAYAKEYDIGQRSLVDLLNAENQLFNAEVSLESAKGVVVFADYQLLAAMGKLLQYLKAPHPVDAEPLGMTSYGLVPYALPPTLVNLPDRASAPVKTNPRASTPLQYAPTPKPQKSGSFTDRWNAFASTTNSGSFNWLPNAGQQPTGPAGANIAATSTGLFSAQLPFNN